MAKGRIAARHKLMREMQETSPFDPVTGQRIMSDRDYRNLVALKKNIKANPEQFELSKMVPKVSLPYRTDKVSKGLMALAQRKKPTAPEIEQLDWYKKNIRENPEKVRLI